MNSFFSELRRRNVYKVAVAYAVVAWLFIQAASILFPTFDAPSWMMKVLVILLILGFLVALLIAWSFEMTPQGMKRTENISPNEYIPQWSRRKFFALIGALGLMATALLVYQLWRPPRAITEPAVNNKSIAVLPFASLSDDKANDYFASGMQDEILTRLARISDLKVISRTSTQKYKSTPENLRDIAHELGVANILEGSVQRSGEQLRISVQLINALTDAHVWGETYDRGLNDIFKVESEIAKTIADNLQAKLSGSEQHALAARPTENAAAYQLYLKGRFFWNKRTADDLKKALEYFNQAVEADPNYALAYAGIADVYNLMPTFTAGTPQDSYPKSEAAARKAVVLDPASAEAHTALGCLLSYRLDFAGAEREYLRALELNPNYATAHQWYADSVLAPTGRFDAALLELKRALELDPLSPILNAELGNAYNTLGRYGESMEQFRKAIEIEPRFFLVHNWLADALESRGNHEAAIAEYQKAMGLGGDAMVLGGLANAYGASGNLEEAQKIFHQLEEMAKQQYVPAYSFALAQMGLGDKAGAIGWLEKSYADAGGTDVLFIASDPLWQPLRDEPRFQKLVSLVFGENPALLPNEQ